MQYKDEPLEPRNASTFPQDHEEVDPEALRFFNRSPHPYHRRSASIDAVDRPDDLSTSLDEGTSPQHTGSRERARRPGCLEWTTQFKTPHSSSDSGSEADDESYSVFRALPAPPIKPRKGLRDLAGELDGSNTPLLSPAQVDEDGQKYETSYFQLRRGGIKQSLVDEEAIAARKRYVKRRRAEMLRRTTEVGLNAVIGVIVIRGITVSQTIHTWHSAELVSYISMVPALALTYFTRILFFRPSSHGSEQIPFRERIRIPAAFDPATLLYPVLLPVMVTLSITPAAEHALLPNIILGLASIPPRLVQFGASHHGYNVIHWFISIVPLILSENTVWVDKTRATTPYLLKSGPPDALRPDDLAILYALHQALLSPLQYLTTTSLLPAELQLLSVALINVLLFAQSSQTTILSIIIWVGGLGVFIMCGKVLTWGVQLARIPRWRFRRVGAVIKARQSFITALKRGRKSHQQADGPIEVFDSEEDDKLASKALQRRRRESIGMDALKAFLPDSMQDSDGLYRSLSARHIPAPEPTPRIESRQRSNTLSALELPSPLPRQPSTNRRRPRRSEVKSLLELTPAQATTRKWVYAAYIYVAIISLILGPIRYLVAQHALQGNEPFGWALGYLAGGIPRFRDLRRSLDLEPWIPLPPLFPFEYDDLSSSLCRADHVRTQVIGAANTRLCIAAYCVVVLGFGMLTVLGLPSTVEVDTRRKVFHGMMVLMLLPTIFIDPAFVSLALIIILAVFLLLDLIRASQLPPLSKPLAYFLQPYVDGRDLRGPVVVSHIFLLIGCAIPLWLSLGGMARTGVEPWDGWDVVGRDVSMLAGVVCVGMGDAAASLVGRRFGRRKWPWAGGKSLEGSAAFAGAVTMGLMFGKTWLWAGGWDEASTTGSSWVSTLCKALGAACGASLMEAVLTGGNDNVIVPVVLWLLVRGLRM
ncbi:hypothetical protein EJ05DRAFT_499662 [Pseudovirgaria hyperparasitica]|uniref:dolichol kinase n=1 Tax=Pseudovirgaria hyperparasitica TaxID=470096 RepID=A0A6A6WCF4_9PEZI|nr:uncharacterized protein EJ05DRAFT_499662 [Pseudovirgaria hyperparasitica]KAF2759247.1 hypothetical protein EJ05DRAFT_499662 [Pseudovirgaria hyperparasitica]